MSSIETLKQDIRVIGELGEITEVLEQVAAKNIIETRSGIMKSRNFFEEAWMIYNIVRAATEIGPEVNDRDLIIMITPNKGMSGNLLNRVINKAEDLYTKRKADLLITGKKGHNHFMNRDERTIHFFSIPNNASFEDIEPLRKIVSKYSRVHFVYPRYISMTQQEVQIASLINEKKETDVDIKGNNVNASRFIFEPSMEEVVNYLNKTIIGVLFFNYFSESLLAYNAAQMLAMKDAHDNAMDQSKDLLFRYHKLRREVIDSKLRDLYKFKYIIEKEA